MDLQEKLNILADAAKYDVSCSSSGSARGNQGGVGNGSLGGICHAWTSDGRCVSLLKVLLTNRCRYDCLYCANRRSNDRRRAAFEPEELVQLTIGFYRRNYIEGLFLSSGIQKSPDHTMEQFLYIVRMLRERERFFGYIHVKAIPGADPLLIEQVGRYADRMSVNIELPSESSLALLAPDKTKRSILTPMHYIGERIKQNTEETRLALPTQNFLPAGQSTQMIVGASPDSDRRILLLSEAMYRKFGLKRVYYSAYMPLNHDTNLPEIPNPPLLREHRLYQSDWLLRFYGFEAHELLDESQPQLDLSLDPKAAWALRHIDQFPVEVNTAPKEMLLRIPGVGLKSVERIVQARRVGSLSADDLKGLGVVLKRAQHFILCRGRSVSPYPLDAGLLSRILRQQDNRFLPGIHGEQLSFIEPATIGMLDAGKPFLITDGGEKSA